VLSAAATPASSTPVLTTAPLIPTRDQRALLTLFVDDGDHGETEVIVRDKDILVSVAALEKAGIHSFAGTREVLNGKPMVSLASLAPAITYRFDDRDLTLKISAGVNLLATHNLNLELQKPADLEFRADTSAFFNYSSILGNLSTWNGFFEGGVSYKGGLFYSGLLASNGTIPSRADSPTTPTMISRICAASWPAIPSFRQAFSAALACSGALVSRRISRSTPISSAFRARIFPAF
jgi:hypothetical protein